MRISGGSVRLGRTKIARSIRKSQPSPHNRLFQPLSLLLLFLLLLLQATRPWPEISTGIFSFSPAPLDFSQLGIGHHCWKTDSKLAPAVLSTCPHRGWLWMRRPRIRRRPATVTIFSSPIGFFSPTSVFPLFLHLRGKSALGSTARPHWLRKVEISAAIGLLASFRGIVDHCLVV